MNYLSVESLSKAFGERILFKNLSFGIDKGQKVALVAQNGAGKTTLMRILAGKEPTDSGDYRFNKSIKIGMLDQDPDFSRGGTVFDYLFESPSPIVQAVKRYERLIEAYEHDPSEANNLALQEATLAVDNFKAWDLELRIRQILTLFNIHDPDKDVRQLSGGQKKRVALSRVLIEEPDFLILDEPTNHLDLDMIEWLEKYLSQSTMTLLLVTHDRYFLDRICTEILEMTDGQLFHHKGNYSFYLEKKSEREDAESRVTEKARNLMRTELEWVRRMPQARGTKAKYRLDAFEELKKKAAGKGPTEQLAISMSMSRMGKKILEINHLHKAFGEQILVEDFSYVFKRGERVGIVGKNGVGKSTFLNMVTGSLLPDSGEIVTGETIVYGYYNQMGIQLPEDKRVIEVIKDIAEVIPMANGSSLTASQLLQTFLFSPKTQYSYVSTLSGGERRRLYLLTILVKNPNFLILDEPTNDLDLMTLTVLEDFLSSFGGCLIVVSHDRYFMDKLVDHLFIFEGSGKITDFNGTYSYYRAVIDAQLEAEQEAKQLREQQERSKQNKAKTPEKQKSKRSYKEQKEYENLEKEIALLEVEKATLTDQVSQDGSDYQKIQAASLRIKEIDQLLDEKTMRWLELDEMQG